VQWAARNSRGEFPVVFHLMSQDEFTDAKSTTRAITAIKWSIIQRGRLSHSVFEGIKSRKAFSDK